MKQYYLLILLLSACINVSAQDSTLVFAKDSNAVNSGDTNKIIIDAKRFFIDDNPITATLKVDFSLLLNNTNKDRDVDAVFSLVVPDSAVISEEITIRPRGNFRLQECVIPPLKVNFKNALAPKLSVLKSLKLVNGCRTGTYNDQLVLKEFLVYKICNLLSEKSFHVRLVNLKLEDRKEKKKPIILHSFFIEDIDDLAKRNSCKKLDESIKMNTEATDRDQMTFVALFQYMIGNTDWAVPNNHNIRLMRSRKDSLSRPFAVPYDFDYSGLVNASYAVPDEKLGTASVLERVYRGFPRSMVELNAVLDTFKAKKEKIYAMINNFSLLQPRNKSQMTGYLDEFYKTIKSDRIVKYEFIDHARIE